MEVIPWRPAFPRLYLNMWCRGVFSWRGCLKPALGALGCTGSVVTTYVQGYQLRLTRPCNPHWKNPTAGDGDAESSQLGAGEPSQAGEVTKNSDSNGTCLLKNPAQQPTPAQECSATSQGQQWPVNRTGGKGLQATGFLRCYTVSSGPDCTGTQSPQSLPRPSGERSRARREPPLARTVAKGPPDQSRLSLPPGRRPSCSFRALLAPRWWDGGGLCIRFSHPAPPRRPDSLVRHSEGWVPQLPLESQTSRCHSPLSFRCAVSAISPASGFARALCRPGSASR